jgi:hypothetical protein
VKAFLTALCMTCFDLFNVPVFWPILLIYFLTLFALTMKRQIKHMIKYRHARDRPTDRPTDLGRVGESVRLPESACVCRPACAARVPCPARARVCVCVPACVRLRACALPGPCLRVGDDQNCNAWLQITYDEALFPQDNLLTQLREHERGRRLLAPRLPARSLRARRLDGGPRHFNSFLGAHVNPLTGRPLRLVHIGRWAQGAGQYPQYAVPSPRCREAVAVTAATRPPLRDLGS